MIDDYKLKLAIRGLFIGLFLSIAVFLGCKNNTVPSFVRVELVEPPQNSRFDEPDSIFFQWEVTSGEFTGKFEVEIASTPDTNIDGSFQITMRRIEVEGTGCKLDVMDFSSGRYYWHVRPMLPQLEWSPISSFSVKRIINVAPPAPMTPDSGQFFEDTEEISFVWLSSTNASRYELQIATDARFEDLVIDTTIEDTEFVWVDARSGSFWWHVRGILGHAASRWTTPRYFSVTFTHYDRIPPPLMHPEDNSSFLFPNGILFEWGEVRGAIRYRFQICSVQDCISPVLDTITESTMVYLNAPLNPSGFWWRVKSIGFRDSSDWSEIRHLEILPRIIQHIDVPSAIKSLVDNGYLFILEDSAGLLIYDIHDMFAPSQIGGILWHRTGLEDMAKSNNLILIPSHPNDGIRVIDVTNPNNPVNVTTYTRIQDGRLIEAEGNSVFVSTTSDSIFAFNITNVHRPAIYGPFAVGARVNDMALLNNYLFILTDNGIAVYDVSDLSNLVPVNRIPLSDSPIKAFIDGAYMFIGTGNGRLMVWDISSPALPNKVAQLRVSGFPISSIASIDSVIVIGLDGVNVLSGVVFKNGTLTGPGYIQTEAPSNGITVNGNCGFISTDWGIAIADFRPEGSFIFFDEYAILSILARRMW